MADAMSGKSVVITGAGNGLGRASAQMMAARGARVAVLDIDAGGAEETAAAVTAAGGTAITAVGDIAASAAAHALFDAAVAAFRWVDCRAALRLAMTMVYGA